MLCNPPPHPQLLGMEQARKQSKKIKQNKAPKSAQIYKGKKKKAGRELFLVATHDCGALMSVICSWAKTFICRQLTHNSNLKIMSAFAQRPVFFFPFNTHC